MSSDFYFAWDDAALRKLFESEDGPVGKDLKRRAIKVRNAAVRASPVDTGRLRSSIAEELGHDSQGLVARIGTNVYYGPFVELGTWKMRAQPYLRPALSAAR